MTDDAHPAVHGERMKLSDVIETLAGLRSQRHDYLCNYLHDHSCHIYAPHLACAAADAIQDFVSSQLRRHGHALATLFRVLALEDGCEYGNFCLKDTPEFLEARDKFCLDYAAFLREFGF